MAVNKKSSDQFEIGVQSILAILAPIMFEWLLIFLLFTHAAFSYIITKFASYCKLQIPCLICSRLDHVFGHEKHGFYWDLICGTHKVEISSHVLCCFRDKLVDFHGLCDGCILFSAAINTSNAENYNKLVGSCMESGHGSSHLQPSSIKNCSLFNDLCIIKNTRPISFPKKRDEPEAIDINLSPSNEISYKHERFENKKGNLSGSCSSSKYVNQRSYPLSHVGYTELKIASDTESDISTSDDNATAAFYKAASSKEVVENNSVKLEYHSTSSAQGLIPIIEIDDEKHENCLVMANTDLGEMGLYQIDSVERVKTVTVSSLQTPLVDVHSDVDGVEANRNERSETTCTMETEIIGKAVSGPLIELAVETGSQMSSNLELGDAYRLVVGEEQQLSKTIPEQWDNKDSKNVGDDVKLLVSQISANRVNDLVTLNDVSPRVSLDSEELKSSDASGFQLQHRRVSLERNESGFESIDGSVVSEIEGESLVDRLKRQVEHDTKSLKALYKELEEERNASAVAASQAMAMITRLQEEKASLHMEALQYLREMEEQAEYDTDALQNANDLLVEKEKEVQDLDEEFRSYRMKFPNSAALGSEADPTSDHNEFDQVVVDTDKNSAECSENTIRETTNPLSVLEEEKKNITESLQRLKMKILQLSGSEICSVSTTGACYENETGENDSKLVNIMDLGGNGVNEDILCHSEGDGVKEVDGSATMHVGYVSHSCNGSCDIVQCGSVISENSDLASIGVEVSVLIEKVSALDENINFLSDVIRSFVNQEEGIHFVREIICYLQELNISAKKQSKTGLLTS